jgi:hypothetical protein
LENTPLKELSNSIHPRAKSLLQWIESSEENREWYLKNI